MKNSKGFTLVELLGVIVIMGIISAIAIVAYTNHLNSTRNKAYDILARSASNAAGEYSMAHIGIESVTLQELVEEEFLENANDPIGQGKKCTGKVDIIQVQSEDGIDVEKYEVTLCCARASYIYSFPGGKKKLTVCG